MSKKPVKLQNFRIYKPIPHVRKSIMNERGKLVSEATLRNKYNSKKGNDIINNKRNLCMLALNRLKAYVKL
mgnify:CR=1 FL=1